MQEKLMGGAAIIAGIFAAIVGAITGAAGFKMGYRIGYSDGYDSARARIAAALEIGRDLCAIDSEISYIDAIDEGLRQIETRGLR